MKDFAYIVIQKHAINFKRVYPCDYKRACKIVGHFSELAMKNGKITENMIDWPIPDHCACNLKALSKIPDLTIHSSRESRRNPSQNTYVPSEWLTLPDPELSSVQKELVLIKLFIESVSSKQTAFKLGQVLTDYVRREELATLQSECPCDYWKFIEVGYELTTDKL
jgi:hypothetical protein